MSQNVSEMFREEWHGGTVGSIILSHIQGPGLDPELGLLSVWTL